MFFPDKIKSIKRTDKVLEIGPGATPHDRSDIFLELQYETEDELIAQSGNVGLLNTKKPIKYYSGEKFPFDDNEFDYVICSHVLEHVKNLETFVSEVTRVSKKGYYEFPTIYYDYIYDIPEHLNLLFYLDGKVNWIKKSETGLLEFKKVQSLFYHTLNLNYHDYINQLKNYFFQGFEWDTSVEFIKITNINDLTFDISKIDLPIYHTQITKTIDKTFVRKLKSGLIELLKLKSQKAWW